VIAEATVQREQHGMVGTYSEHPEAADDQDRFMQSCVVSRLRMKNAFRTPERRRMRIASTVHDIGELWFSLSERCSAANAVTRPEVVRAPLRGLPQMIFLVAEDSE
jgi:hypothetical protein